MRLTTTLTDGLRAALAKAGLPALDECVWEIPRQAEHGDYATNAAMVLARLLRAQGVQVTTEFYVNDAGSQFEALARSFEARVRQELGEPAALPDNGYPGEYLVDLAREYRAEGGGLPPSASERERIEHF